MQSLFDPTLILDDSFLLFSADRRATARTTNLVEPCSFQTKKNTTRKLRFGAQMFFSRLEIAHSYQCHASIDSGKYRTCLCPYICSYGELLFICSSISNCSGFHLGQSCCLFRFDMTATVSSNATLETKNNLAVFRFCSGLRFNMHVCGWNCNCDGVWMRFDQSVKRL